MVSVYIIYVTYSLDLFNCRYNNRPYFTADLTTELLFGQIISLNAKLAEEINNNGRAVTSWCTVLWFGSKFLEHLKFSSSERGDRSCNIEPTFVSSTGPLLQPSKPYIIIHLNQSSQDVVTRSQIIQYIQYVRNFTISSFILKAITQIYFVPYPLRSSNHRREVNNNSKQ